MRNTYGQCNGQNTDSASASVDTRDVSAIQSEFFRFLHFQGIPELVTSFKLVHDLALYHSDLIIDNEERLALFHVKIIWEELEKLE